jgi:hypothetical protein
MHLSDLQVLFILAQGVGLGLLLFLIGLECMARTQAMREVNPPANESGPDVAPDAIDVQWTEVGNTLRRSV